EEGRTLAEYWRSSLFDHWEMLGKILERHEDTIRKRWSKKSHQQRKAVLLEAWPGMPRQHRPDFYALRRDEERLDGDEPTQDRDAYLWPYINQEDLSKGKVFLILLHARGHFSPSEFRFVDIEAPHAGHQIGLLDGIGLPDHYMSFRECSRSHYGSIVKSRSFADWGLGLNVDPADGFEILEIQERIMRFLCVACKSILHDKGPDFTASAAYPILPVLPAPTSEESEWLSITSIALQSQYTRPEATDLLQLKALIDGRVAAADDHILALQEDPRFFADYIRELEEHNVFNILMENGKPGPKVTDVFRRKKLYNEFIFPAVVYTAIESAYWWHELKKLFEEVLKAERIFTERMLTKEEDLPGFVLQLQKLKRLLIDHMELYLFQRLQAHYPASSPMRSYFLRKTDPEDPRILRVETRSSDDGETKDELMWLLNRLNDARRVHKCGMASLLLEIDRLMFSDKKQKNRITALLADTLSDMGLVAEIQHQLERYRPRIFLTSQRVVKHLSVQEFPLQRSPWYKDIQEPLNELFKVCRSLKVGPKADYFVGRLNYPSQKRRTKENVAVMQEAEYQLDQFWVNVRKHLQQDMKSGYEVIKRLWPATHEINRTQDWQEQECISKPSRTVVEDLKALEFERQQRTEASIDLEPSKSQKFKTKTKGSSPSQSNNADDANFQATPDLPDSEPQRTIFTLKKRAFKVFNAIFHNPESPDAPGEVPWTEFLYAMHCVDFVPKKLYGSVWQFSPKHENLERSIHFHEPHPSSKLTYYNAKKIGRRLNRAYGWSAENF
ncbi:hypothetical protein EJ04DRAFT_398625, partial [Polyplosphaeria fusca]